MEKTHFGRRFLSGGLAFFMAMTLCSCEDSEGLTMGDASKCVQVEMDTTYKGDFSGFLEFYSNVTTADAEAQYSFKIEQEAGYFMELYGVPSLEDEDEILEPSDRQVSRAREIYKSIYSRADYTIVSSSKQDDGTFAVKVNVRPLDIIRLVEDNFDVGFEAFWAKYDKVNTESLSKKTFENWYTRVVAPEYYDTLLDLLEAQLPYTGYLDEQSIVIQVRQAEDESLYISDEDLWNLDVLIIDYSA